MRLAGLWDASAGIYILGSVWLTQKEFKSKWVSLSVFVGSSMLYVYFRRSFRSSRLSSTSMSPVSLTTGLQQLKEIVSAISVSLSPASLDHGVLGTLGLLSVLDNANYIRELRFNRVLRRSSLHELPNIHVLLKAKELVQYASGAYGYAGLSATGLYHGKNYIDSKVTLAKFLKLDQSAILHKSDVSEIILPKYYIAVDESRIILAIRGSFNLTDILTDLIADSLEFQGGLAHRGVALSASSLFEECKDILGSAIDQYPDKELVVCGHSLGGAVAILFTMIALQHDIDLECYAFGPPPVFAPLENVPMETRRCIHVFINEDDLISRMSLASVNRVLRRMEHVDQLNVSWFRKWCIILLNDYDGLVGIMNKQNVSTRRVMEEEKYPDFYHPGNIYWIIKSTIHPNNVSISVCAPIEFIDIVISNHCFENHTFLEYIKVLGSL